MNKLLKTTFTTRLALPLLVSLGGMLPLSGHAFDYPEPGNFALGAKQWADNCARCHNIRSATELRDDQWITTLFHMRVRAGLTGEEMRNILTFLQESNKADVGKVVKTSAAPASGAAGLSGEAIYQQTCIACHGANGKGVFPGVPDFTRADGRLSKSDSKLLNNIAEGLHSPGSTMAMPPRGGNTSLSDDDLKQVLKYLRSEFGS